MNTIFIQIDEHRVSQLMREHPWGTGTLLAFFKYATLAKEYYNYLSEDEKAWEAAIYAGSHAAMYRELYSKEIDNLITIL
jgi:hypothetical protein